MDNMQHFLLSASTNIGYEALLILAFILLFGLYAGRFFEKIKLPHITGYIIMGVIIGLFSVIFSIEEIVEKLEIVSGVALGFIAFGIGSELEFGKLKKSGKEVVVITFIQAIAAALFTLGGLLIFGVSLPIALVLGAIATATAPAPIMLLTRKYKSRGDLTDTLLPLVGMDDAVGIVLFGVLLSVANSMKGTAEITVIEMLEGPALELLFSAIIGAVVGFLAALMIKKISSKDSQKEEVFLGVAVFAVFLTVALAKMGLNIGGFAVHLSPILTPMIMGVILTNSLSRVRAHDVNDSVESFSAPILVAFFTLAGAELVMAFGGLAESGADVDYGMIAVITTVYILFRIIGKLLGSYAGAKVMNSHRNVRKYLGICLLPQAGVALGMAYQAKTDFGDEGTIILVVVLIATLVYELFGPIGVKYSLEKSGEIRDY